MKEDWVYNQTGNGVQLGAASERKRNTQGTQLLFMPNQKACEICTTISMAMHLNTLDNTLFLRLNVVAGCRFYEKKIPHSSRDWNRVIIGYSKDMEA